MWYREVFGEQAMRCNDPFYRGHEQALRWFLLHQRIGDDFIFEPYQLPMLNKWGLVAYGCCEDLTQKIDMLRQIHKLRQIAVTPVANVAKCAEQIRDDYVFSWRPNPTDMVCCGFDEAKIRAIIREGLSMTRDCRVHLHLKDVETVEGDVDRLGRWVEIVRDEISKQ